MNIFALDLDPRRAAQMQNDKHVVKMTLETTQLLSGVLTSFNVSAPYAPTHLNHPCAIWARTSRGNFQWLLHHGLALAEEYSYRYGADRAHKCRAIILGMTKYAPQLEFNQEDFTPFAQAMPDQYRHDDAVRAYRAYYVGEKMFTLMTKNGITIVIPATWTRRGKPLWIMMRKS